MKNLSLVEYSIRRPRRVLWITLGLTLVFLLQFPKIRIDTNPKNMLPETSEVRMRNDEVDRMFSLYEDTVVVGVQHESGVLNPQTLQRLQKITEEITALKGVASRDVNALGTITNVTADGDTIRVGPLMRTVPRDATELRALEQALLGNRLFVNRVISQDGKTTAIYVPLEKGANGAEIADQIRDIVTRQGGQERYFVVGDPVARDTFGAEMFKLMGIFSPIAGAIMFLVIQLMFRNVSMSLTMMGVAMVAIIISMGALIAAGIPVHIMSSMAPVFLMAIATDSIHIFNEYSFRVRETRDRQEAIRQTMAAVGSPVRYTALATAAGFAVLMLMHIVPVKVFGALIAFGTVLLRVFSFSLIPAVLTFISAESMAAREPVGSGGDVVVRWLRRLGAAGTRRSGMTLAVSLVVLAASVAGAMRLHVNNNMVAWFKPSSDIRVADARMSHALGGTSLGYLTVQGSQPEALKDPAVMRWIDGLQRELEKLPQVGKTFSVVDYVRRINQVLHQEAARYDTVPDSAEQIGQYLFLFGMSAKPADLNNVIDPGYQKANITVQLRSWDAEVMREVITVAETYQRTHPMPVVVKPAGVAYFNMVWNDEVLGDMVFGFGLALCVVFIIMVMNFRSVLWAAIGYVPLLFTIALIYGVIGYSGLDFDMPLSVLSTLSLGMAVDFSIHFINRLRRRLAEGDGRTDVDSLRAALIWTAERPGRGIVRNAFLFGSAFSVMLFAPLTPYVAVGAFILSMMLLSALLTLVLVPALVILGRRWLYATEAARNQVGHLQGSLK